jgi:hypothetical protein
MEVKMAKRYLIDDYRRRHEGKGRSDPTRAPDERYQG